MGQIDRSFLEEESTAYSHTQCCSAFIPALQQCTVAGQELQEQQLDSSVTASQPSSRSSSSRRRRAWKWAWVARTCLIVSYLNLSLSLSPLVPTQALDSIPSAIFAHAAHLLLRHDRKGLLFTSLKKGVHPNEGWHCHACMPNHSARQKPMQGPHSTVTFLSNMKFSHGSV